MKRRICGWCIATLGVVGLAASLTACGSAVPKGIGSTHISPGQSLFVSKNFAHALDKLKAQAGGDNINLFDVDVTPGEAQFKFADGETAKEYDYFPNGDKLLPPSSTFSGPVNPGGRSLAGRTFPIVSLNPSVVDTLAADLKKANPAYAVQVLDLSKASSAASPTGGPVWAITAKSSQDSVGYLADIDGSNFRVGGAPLPGSTSPSAATQGAPPAVAGAVRDAQKKAKCVQKAGGDITKIQACVTQ